jgi:quercetin dioxygenase-like cupin family protein
MKRAHLVVGVAAFMGATALAVGWQRQAGAVTYAAAEAQKYQEVMPGVSRAVLWGDPDKGAHGTFTRFVPGFDAGMHTHTNDVTLVVFKGAYVYRDEAGEKRVGPGQFLRVPGGKRHWSGGDKTEGALFYQHSNASFDLVAAK